jgi:Fuc2NAc and GlcNAc transferase
MRPEGLRGVMNWAVSLSAIGLAVALSWALTLAARRYALRRQMLDTPNRRSSHTAPRPRGLGIGFALCLFAWTLASFWLFPSDSQLWCALSGGGLLVGAVGWLDDRKGLPSWLRLLFYGLASAWAVAWLGGLPDLRLGTVSVPLGAFGYPLAWVGVFTLTNIYSFMDGIDGLAAAEGIFVTVAAGTFLFLSGVQGLALFCWVFGAALCGFIPWNWAPAKGFMGDVGSNFLGFTIAVLAIASEGRHSLPALIWVLLLGVFVVDGPEKERLIKRAEHENLTNVEFRTAVPKTVMPAILAEGDAVVALLEDTPLYRYGISLNKHFDYMAAGKPIVLAGNAAHNYIEIAQCGLTVPPRDPEGLVGPLSSLLRCRRMPGARWG